MTVFFTSDQHLGHKNILKYEPHRAELWDTPDEMNAGMCEIWNSVVQPEDTVYVIGDWAMGKLSESLQWTPLFNGHKILVLGNHDKPFSGKQKAIDLYYEAGFDYLIPGVFKYFPPASSDLPPVLLSHFPYAPAGDYDNRYADCHPEDNGMILLHGHVHSAWKFRHPRQINVGCDVWNFKPQTLPDLLSSLEKDHLNNVKTD